jgi:hypothetical protein
MVLFAVPRDAREALPWVLSVALELFVARHCWQIDFIPDHVHAVSSAKWDLDPSGVSVTCQAPAEVGKLAAAAFVVSALAQFTVVLVAAAVDARRTAQRRVGAMAAVAEDVVLDGVPEVAYAAHGVAGFAFAGSVAARALNLWVRHPRRYRHCPHVKVLGVFKFAVLANCALLAWYLALAYAAFGMVVAEFFEARAGESSVSMPGPLAAMTSSNKGNNRAPGATGPSSKRD